MVSGVKGQSFHFTQSKSAELKSTETTAANTQPHKHRLLFPDFQKEVRGRLTHTCVPPLWKMNERPGDQIFSLFFHFTVFAVT